MIILAAYFSKVILCSTLFYFFYYLLLRNKQSHDFNRFYLLGITFFSWFIPLFKIDIFQMRTIYQPKIYKILDVVNDGNIGFENMFYQNKNYFTWDSVLLSLYLLVSTFMLFYFIKSVVKIYSLIKTYPSEISGTINLIRTDVDGTPFSFFNYVLWNNKIDLNSSHGKRMLVHEIVHIKEKHSLDKVYIQLLLVMAWANPIFWIIKKELYMVHEFSADCKSIEKGNSKQLAEILLTAIFPQQQFIMTNSFFYSPIKRRLIMITKNSSQRLIYLRKTLILLISGITIFMLSFRIKDGINLNPQVTKTYTVVIDAGHGGEDAGAIASDGSKEKSLVLDIVQKVKGLNINPNIKILLTRNTDELVPLKDRTNFSNTSNPNLFISIHVGAASPKEPNYGGIDLIVSKRNLLFNKESIAVASVFSSNVGYVFEKSNGLKNRNAGVWVLDNVNCPAILIECGYLTNSKDLQILKTRQTEIAKKILESINDYLVSTE